MKTIQTITANEFSSYFYFKNNEGTQKSFNYIEILPSTTSIRSNKGVFNHFIIVDDIKYNLSLERRRGVLNAGLWNHNIKSIKMFASETPPTQDEIEFLEDVMHG